LGIIIISSSEIHFNNFLILFNILLLFLPLTKIGRDRRAMRMIQKRQTFITRVQVSRESVSLQEE